MNLEEINEMEREHEKALLALEQEIEGWKSTNRILTARVEQQTSILKSLTYTVLADFTHMSEYHINSTIVELAKKSEQICEIDIKSRATDELIQKHWNLE